MSASTDASVVASEVDDRIGLRQFLAGLVVLAIVGGAFLLTFLDSNSPYPDASGRINDLYAAGAQELFDAIDPRVYEALGIGEDEVVSELDNVIAGGANVVSEEVVVIAGTPISRVGTASGLSWCVRPDGKLLLVCEVGALNPQFELEGIDATVEIDAARLSIEQGALVQILVIAEPGTTLELSSTPEVVGDSGSWVLQGVAAVTPMGVQPPGDTITLDDGTRGIIQVTANFDRTGAITPADFTLDFGDGRTITFTIPAPDYWFD